ncbi:MAG: helix-turn-helix domain-containing protein [Chloroflexota bacterium]
MKRTPSQIQTPGGNRLRALRDDCGRTQLDVELDASLGIGYLQRVESGKVRYPERDTLERILAALGAHYSERAEILELFGYVVDTPLPDEAEIGWAVDTCRMELSEAVFPAYLLDCGNHLLAWNACFARLFQVERLDERVSMVRLIFDARYGITGRIANPDEFFPAQIRALRYQMRLFRGEGWYAPLISDLNNCPLFRHYWEHAEEQPSLAARPLIPVMIKQADGEMLRFRLTSEPFAQDRRFRMIYYLPADAPTTQQCVAWIAGGG